LNNNGDYLDFDTTETNTKTLAHYVAAIGEKKYSTLQDAISASTEEQSIVLLSDVILKSYLSIPYNKTITLDLAGHTLDRWLYRTDETMCMN
jgi:hypothetical protein